MEPVAETESICAVMSFASFFIEYQYCSFSVRKFEHTVTYDCLVRVLLKMGFYYTQILTVYK
jgi:hypothetical protein